MWPTSRITSAFLLAVSLSGAPAAALAADPAAAPERAAMTRAVRAFLTPAQADRVTVAGARVSTADRRFAALRLRGPEVGDRVAVLGRAGPGWRVLDVGTPSVGCGLLPAAALDDLGLACPVGVVVVARAR